MNIRVSNPIGKEISQVDNEGRRTALWYRKSRSRVPGTFYIHPGLTRDEIGSNCKVLDFVADFSPLEGLHGFGH